MSSDTSSEINLNFVDNNGNKIDLNKDETDKKLNTSSNTDMYFNMLANKSKEKEEEVIETTSVIQSSSESSDSDSSSSSVNSNSSKSKKKTSPIELNFNNNKDDKNKTPSPKRTPSFTPPVKPTTVPLTAQELRMKKIELLRKLSEIKAKGYDLSKKYDFNSSIDEMEYEYELLKSFANKRNGIKLYKNILLNTTSAIEFLNDKYDPFDFQLSGWSEHMSVEVDSYEDVLEELYEKYKGTGKKMPPEVKLVLLMVASASAFHFTKSYAKSSAIESMMKNNPNIVSNILNPKKESSQFMTQQEINLEKQKELARQREKLQREAAMKKAESEVKMNTFKNNYNPVNQMNANPMPTKVNIQAPSNVEEILQRLHASDENNSVEKKNNRLVSESTLSSDTNGVKKKRGRKKKQIMSIV